MVCLSRLEYHMFYVLYSFVTSFSLPHVFSTHRNVCAQNGVYDVPPYVSFGFIGATVLPYLRLDRIVFKHLITGEPG
jgi:hypothetical protein